MRGRWNTHRSGDRNNNYQNYNRQGNTRPNYRQNAQWTFRNRSQSRNRNDDHTRGRSRSIPRRREESRSQSNSRVSTNHDPVRCYRCREYDHFASECLNTPTDEETDYEDVDPASLQIMTQNYCLIDSEGGSRIFKLVKGKNGTTPFFLLKVKTGGKVKYIQDKEAMCLTKR